MLIENKKISQIAEEARELVENLKILKKEAGSYQTAKEKLNETNSSLSSLIEKTRELSEESHKIIKEINEIGSNKIFKKLEQIKTQLKSIEEKGNNTLKSLKIMKDKIELSNSENKNILKELKDLDEKLEIDKEYKRKIFTYIVISLAIIFVSQILFFIFR